MSELKVYHHELRHDEYEEFYLKFEADKVIAEKDADICRLKNGIAPKYSDKTLQERLNEVCEKHGVSTLQDLDWAFCESEKRQTNYFIEAYKEITHHKYKRCLNEASYWVAVSYQCVDDKHRRSAERHRRKWLELSKQFKEGDKCRG